VIRTRPTAVSNAQRHKKGTVRHVPLAPYTGSPVRIEDLL
jgi:hypothetical protein